MKNWHEFELVQDGLVVASAGSANRQEALREIMHYAMIYSQDGPCEIKGTPEEDMRPFLDAAAPAPGSEAV